MRMKQANEQEIEFFPEGAELVHDVHGMFLFKTPQGALLVNRSELLAMLMACERAELDWFMQQVGGSPVEFEDRQPR